MKWLRPVSQASDMSAIQDGLWLTRCKPFLERFSSLSQFGGKYDAIALLVAVMLHVQIRDYQGLMSYVLFADMKQAFDFANKDLMLYMCYLAGITATEWLLLYDFFIFFQSGQSCRPSWGVLNWYDEICSRYPARPSV